MTLLNRNDMTLFGQFLEQRLAYNHLDFVPIGGFIPGEVLSVFQSNVFEAKDEGTSVRSMILFNEDDIEYLRHFPPAAHLQALTLRYGLLLLHAKRLKEAGEQIPDFQDVLVKGSGNSVLRFRNVKTNMSRLLDRLEMPRNINPSDPGSLYNVADKSQYKNGVHGFDLSNIHKDHGTGHLKTEGFLPMTYEGAKAIIKEWRTGTTNGWLGKTDHPIKPVNYGGGKPGLGFILDHSGRPLRMDQGVQMPILKDTNRFQFDVADAPADLLEAYYLRGDFDADGNLGEVGDPVDVSHLPWKTTAQDHPIPLYLQGKMVSGAAVKQYDLHMGHLKTQFVGFDANNNPQWKNSKEAAEIIEAAMTYLPHSGHENAAVHKDEIDFALGSVGNPNFPSIERSTTKFGATQPLANVPERVAADEKTKKTIQEFLLKSNSGSIHDQWLTKTLDGQTHTESAARKGTAVAIARAKSLYAPVKIVALYSMFDDLAQGSMLEVLGRAGRPAFVKFVTDLKNNSPDAEKSYEIAFKEAERISMSFVLRVAQFDIGGTGSRRKPKSTVSLSAPVAGGEKGLEDIVTGQQSAGGYTRSVLSDKGGEEKHIKGKSLPTITAGEGILMNRSLAEIRRISIERNKKIAEGHATPEQIEESLRKEGTSRVKIADMFYSQYVQAHLSHGDEEVDEKEAIAWATEKTNEFLAGKTGLKAQPSIAAKEISPEKVQAAQNPTGDVASFDDPRLPEMLASNPMALNNAKLALKKTPSLALKMAIDQAEKIIKSQHIKSNVKSWDDPQLIQMLASDPKKLENAKKHQQQTGNKALAMVIAKAEQLAKAV
jgi:hypothetical protein